MRIYSSPKGSKILSNSPVSNWPFIKFWTIFFCLILASGFKQPAFANEGLNEEISLLLSRLDLNAPGLEKVKRFANEPTTAARELLSFYRARKSVKHPVDRFSKADLLGRCADEKDLKTADDALKHIFVGQPAYPPHFCGDDIDWSTSPVPDKEWVWQLNRMYFWDAMARAYWHTSEEKYALEWSRQLVDWTKKNPRDDAHRYAWRSIETGIRGHRWTRLFQYFLDAPSFTPEVLVAFLNSCYDHAAFLTTQYRSGSNWGLMEAEGMAFIAIVFPEFQEAEKWRREAIRRLNREIDIQVNPDGHQRELAIGYHMGCIGWFTRTWELTELNGMTDAFPKSYLQKIERMCEVPMKLGFPDGTTTQFGDSWSGKPGQYQDRFRKWAEMFQRDDFLFMASEGEAGTKPEATAFAYPHSGLYSMRSGWDKDAVCLVLKCGPDGGGHCQPDNGTFELYAGGRHLTPDAGSYIYSGNPEGRAWFRQTSVHQTLTLNGDNSAYAPKLLLWKPGDDLDVLVVENASYEQLTHRRAVFFVDKKFFIIVDEAIGEGEGEIDLHFQLAPGKAVFDKENLSVKTDFEKGWNIMIKTLDQKSIQLEEEEGQVSFVYTKKESRPAFRYRVDKEKTEKGVRFITIVAPFEEAEPNINVKIVRQSPIGGSRLALKINTDGFSRRIKYDLNR